MRVSTLPSPVQPVSPVLPTDSPSQHGARTQKAGATMGRTSMVVGLDLVLISAIADSVERFGRRFLNRVYTPAELRYCLSDTPSAAPRLAARFAAKEAIMKVLRPNDEAISWRSIEVSAAAPGGACDVVLSDEAYALACHAGFTGFSLSMTHEAGFASAVAIGERRQTMETG